MNKDKIWPLCVTFFSTHNQMTQISIRSHLDGRIEVSKSKKWTNKENGPYDLPE